MAASIPATSATSRVLCCSSAAIAFRMAVCLTLAAETTSFLTAETAGCLAGTAGLVAGESTDLFAAAAAGALAAGAAGQARAGDAAETGAATGPAGPFTEGTAGFGVAGETGAAATGATGPCAAAATGFDWFRRSRRRNAASTDLTSCITPSLPLAARTTGPDRSEETKIRESNRATCVAKRNAANYGRTPGRGYALAPLVCCFLRSAQ